MGEFGSTSLDMEMWDNYENEREVKVWEAVGVAQEANASKSPINHDACVS